MSLQARRARDRLGRPVPLLRAASRGEDDKDEFGRGKAPGAVAETVGGEGGGGDREN
jgi:hypothetical protein